MDVSMKKIRLSYAPLQNAGDLFNKDLVERLSGREVVNSKMYNADMIAIGGALVGAQYSGGRGRRMCQRALGLIYGNKPLYVWGSGFFRDDNESCFYRKNLQVCALRGQKTQEKLSRLMGKRYDVPLADAGLLAHLFVDEKIEKKYEIGLIPHMSQLEDEAIKRLLALEGVHLIDIRRTAKEVIDDIASCETVLSSSLHGLIFAAGQGLPLVGLSYDPKVSAFTEYIGSGPCMKLEDVTADQLIDSIDHAISQDGSQEDRLARAEKLKKLEKENVLVARRLLEEDTRREKA
jgi:hypothetical protein